MTDRTCYPSLREFIYRLEVEGELARIKEKVSPILEIAEITDRVSKSPGGGKALLFENVEGSSMPVLINAFGSAKRMAWALGTSDLDSIGAEIESLMHMQPPRTLMDKLNLLPTLFNIAQVPPRLKHNSGAPCQEVIMTGDEVDLFKLPILKCWPDDGGRFITLPCVFTKSLDGKRNVGVYRMQAFNKRSTGMHWHIHKDGAAFFHEYQKAGKRMEVAVAIGCDPATVYAATAPLPPGVDELLLSGFIRGKGVDMVKCRTIDMEVPRTAEIVLEGYVDPDDTRIEGPFGDHTGYYSLTGMYPVFHITAITHRKDPIYLTTIVGKPPMEDCYMGKATERIFLPMLKTVNPEIVDYDLPWEGVFHNCVIVSMKKRYPAQAKKLMSALWGAGQMSFAKMILMVDENVNVHDYREVARVALDRLDIDNGITIAEGVLDVLDHSAPKPLYGAKLGIDVTTPVDGEERGEGESTTGRSMEPILKFIKKKAKIVGHAIPYTDVANPLLIIAIDKKSAGEGTKMAKDIATADKEKSARIILVVDKDIDPANYSVALWKFFNNVDPNRDIIRENGRLIIDATKKLPKEGHTREWPDDLSMDAAVVSKVDEMWKRLGLG